MRLAAFVGLAVPKVEYMTFGRAVLVVERYDRVPGPDASIERIHQEDSCQALGIMHDRKYQADGGPSFKDLAGLIRSACSEPLPCIEALLRIALFNMLIGNCDAHGKNFSLIYRGERTDLAPFYDLVATAAYPDLETRLSMRIGKEYRIDRIGKADLESFALDVGVKPRAVLETRDSMISSISGLWESAASLPELARYADLIRMIRNGFDERAKNISSK